MRFWISRIKGIFCQNLPNFDKIFHLRDFFVICDSIHSLHLRNNFGAFNANVDDFIGKNSEKITKNYPSISYKSQDSIELVISSELSWILTFDKKRWNQSNEFYKISLACFCDPCPPIALIIWGGDDVKDLHLLLSMICFFSIWLITESVCPQFSSSHKKFCQICHFLHFHYITTAFFLFNAPNSFYFPFFIHC